MAIIGLGPAGATLARLLPPGTRAVAIDKKSDSNKGFHKPCGGLLALDAQKALARFDMTLPKSILVDPQIFSVRTIDLSTGLTRYYQRFYINLDRHKFDRWLCSLIPDSVEVHRESVCKKVERVDGGFRVLFDAQGKRREIFARYLVGADGANSIVRSTLYPDKQIRSYVSIQQWFAEKNPNPFYSCVFDPENTDCYSWSISKDGYFIFGGAYPKSGCRARFETQKQKLEKLGYQFGTPLKTEACLVLRPAGIRQFCTGSDGAFLIGEAAGFISPSSLEGISSGINSACRLAEAFSSSCADPNRAYRRSSAGIRSKLTLKLLKCPFMYQPFLRKMVMKSRLNTIDVKSANQQR